mmetsp:Transcript_58281/g.80868  ORF Transcript_58281/g.80868 Transcript_58281/m.80868 type:complete len:121 (-) Transcript_58281:171-533(-)
MIFSMSMKKRKPPERSFAFAKASLRVTGWLALNELPYQPYQGTTSTHNSEKTKKLCSITKDESLIHCCLNLIPVIDVWKRFIWYWLVQEFAERLPTFFHIEDQQFLRRNSGFHSLNPCVE